MRVEVVCWDTCPECGGTMRVTLPELTLGNGIVIPADEGHCDQCEDGTAPRVLATLPDRAELRELIVEALGAVVTESMYDDADAVLELFGLREE